jgi:excinuclease UvrABC ATPase subunit
MPRPRHYWTAWWEVLTEFLTGGREPGTTLLIVSHEAGVLAAGDQVIDITGINRPGYEPGAA